jgi:hypothetical protein
MTIITKGKKKVRGKKKNAIRTRGNIGKTKHGERKERPKRRKRENEGVGMKEKWEKNIGQN